MGEGVLLSGDMKIDFSSQRFSEEDLRGMRKEIDDEIAVRAQARVTPTIRRKYGAYATRVKVRECKGCGQRFNAREMRSHPCTISWTRR